MKAKLLYLSIFSLLLLHTNSSFSQDQNAIDNLKFKIAEAKHDTTIINAYYSIANLYWDYNQETALNYLIKSKEKAENFLKNSPKGSAADTARKSLAVSLSDIGIIYYMNEDYDKAEQLFTEAKNLIQKVYGKEHLQYASCCNNLATIYDYQAKYKEAEPLYLEEKKFKEKLLGKENADYALCCHTLGVLYYYMSDFQKAESFYIEAITIREKVLGKENQDYSTSCNNLAVLYDAMGRYHEAEKLYLETKKIREKIHGKENDGYALSCNNLAVLYDKMNLYKKSEPLYIEAKTIWGNLLGKDHPDYALSCANLAALYDNMGEFEKSEALYLEAKGIQGKVLGRENPDYATTVNNLGLLYYNIGKYEKAEQLYLEAKKIREKVYGKENTVYASSCVNLAGLYRELGKYQKSEELYLEAKEIKEKSLGKNHPSYAVSCNNLAVLYKEMGYYKKAEELYIEAKNIREKTLGKDHNDYATSCNNLALLYMETGYYPKAEQLLIESKKITESRLGKKHPDHATSCNNLAFLYDAMGNYNKAEKLYLEAKEIWKAAFGRKHKDYATSCNNLASLYNAIGKYKEAEQFYIEAMEIDKEVFGTEHIDYAADCNNLAYFYNNLGKYEKAEPLFIKAKNIDGKVLGKNHTAYARDCNNLAVLYDATGRYSKAEDLFIEAKNINKKALGENHKEYALDCSNLAALYEDIGNFNKAENLLLQSISIIDKNVKLNFTFLSEKEKEMYFATINHYYELFNSFALKRKNENPGITAYVYNNTVNNKGLLLKSSTAMRNVILSSNDEELISNYKNWIELKKQIIKLNSSGKETKDLEEQANKVEKELVKGSQYFANDKKTQNNNWKDVQKMLKADEAAIEFVHFKYYNKYWTDSTLYCAIIVKPKSKYPEMIPLFEEKQLLALTDKYGSGSFSYIRNLYGPGNEKNSELYNIIWEPLEKYLENIKTVYISPSGLLHKISFSALCQGQNVYLCDNYNINSQSSTGKIIMPENQKLASNITANIFGGVEYSNDKTETEIWSFLDGTLTETQIINFFLEDKKIKTNYYTESDASEENFKKTSPFCDVLHLATHGFFYPSIEEIEKDTTNNNLSRGGRSGFGVYQFVKNKNPLMRSGLVLAGANNVWQEYTPTIIEDGVLTAEEVASVDLRKAQVVVLSACETGLGDIRGTEGVYGLQRAFKMAGAKFIIMSLWEVPDKETEEFMTTFYSKLLATKDIKLAFIQTQNEMRAKYDPYYWAAFVLIE